MKHTAEGLDKRKAKKEIALALRELERGTPFAEVADRFSDCGSFSHVKAFLALPFRRFPVFFRILRTIPLAAEDLPAIGPVAASTLVTKSRPEYVGETAFSDPIWEAARSKSA